MPQKRTKSQQTALFGFGEKAENYNQNLPEHNTEKWELFKIYCAQDVETERAVRQAIEKYPINETEHRLWCLDQAINDYGVLVDTQMVKHAIKCAANHQRELEKEAVALTGLDNPKSVTQIKNG